MDFESWWKEYFDPANYKPTGTLREYLQKTAEDAWKAGQSQLAEDTKTTSGVVQVFNTVRRPGHNQVCVWPGTTLGKNNDPKEFEDHMLKEFGVRVQFLEIIMTGPDKKRGKPVKGTGGRSDLFFAVHRDDVGKFAVPRLSVGIRWIEDVLDPLNYHSPIYPERVKHYKSW